MLEGLETLTENDNITIVGRTVDIHGGLWYNFLAGRRRVKKDIETNFLNRTVGSHGA
jgi:hypothetical protein